MTSEFIGSAVEYLRFISQRNNVSNFTCSASNDVGISFVSRQNDVGSFTVTGRPISLMYTRTTVHD